MPGIAYFLIFLAYLFIPWVLFLKLPLLTLPGLLFFYPANLLIVILIIQHRNQRLRRTQCVIERLQEQLNLQDIRSNQDHQQNFALSAKVQRYRSLSEILHGLNLELSIQKVAESLSRQVFSLIAGGKGVCTVYVLDAQTRGLSLLYSIREHPQQVVKAKEGDIFDWWVVRQVRALLIEDLSKDFRFDPRLIVNEDAHGFVSLISAPLRSGEKTLGVVRLDNPQAGFFTQDDLRFLVSVCDLAAVAIENSQLYSRARHLSIHDELTGLYTKSYFLQRLQEECVRTGSTQETFGLLMADIDFFKRYNDRFGHIMGDRVLRDLGTLIRQEFAAYNPVVGRFGGEEFCVIIPAADKRKALNAAQHLRRVIESNPITLRRQETRVTISVGVSSFPVFGLDAQTLLESADKALYKAKMTGRNKVCCL